MTFLLFFLFLFLLLGSVGWLGDCLDRFAARRWERRWKR